MDTEKFICNKCSFTTEKLEKLNTHAKKIHVIHNVSNTPDEKPRSTPKTGFHTKETFDEIIDELESRDPPICGYSNCNISYVLQKPRRINGKRKSRLNIRSSS